MARYNSLKEFLLSQSPKVNRLWKVGGVFNNPYEFPLYYIHVNGAVLFADLPGYSSTAKDESPEVCNFITNHFFGWIQTATAHLSSGIVDKYIGDEIMVVFAKEMGIEDPLLAALKTAKAILDPDLFAFEPHIGIAHGEFIISAVGTIDYYEASAIGHTVNLAARCVSSAQSRQIRIASRDLEKVNTVFSENGGKWQIEGPDSVELENVGQVEVITASKRTIRLTTRDYVQIAREGVAESKRLETDKESQIG